MQIKKNQNLFQRLRSNFLTGLVLITPIILTIYLLWGVINFIDDKVVPWLPNKYNPSTYLGKDIPGLGVMTFLVFTTIVGMVTKGFFGRQLIKFWQSLVDRTPVFRSIYNALKQIAETVFTKSDQTFKSACLVEYPRRGIWVVAFVSTITRGEIKEKINKDEILTVFVPTTPNPTSGFLLFIPKKDVIILKMSVENAAKLVISAGLVVPDYNEKNEIKNKINSNH
ncbi:MAG: hypothetical protein CML70_09285 [Rhodobacterales bacterium]|nr:MAG: hypothetical protein CML70_09285 [Rhodobacterales bacterium]